jgi:hypothetical protein
MYWLLSGWTLYVSSSKKKLRKFAKSLHHGSGHKQSFGYMHLNKIEDAFNFIEQFGSATRLQYITVPDMTLEPELGRKFQPTGKWILSACSR